jgi:hypothetical protein
MTNQRAGRARRGALMDVKRWCVFNPRGQPMFDTIGTTRNLSLAALAVAGTGTSLKSLEETYTEHGYTIRHVRVRIEEIR